MSEAADVLADAFERIRDVVHACLENTPRDALLFRPTADTNSVAWLIWHLTRVQDDHLADAFGKSQVWTTGDWADRFDLPFDPGATGYGQSSKEVAAVDVSPELLIGYHDAVYEATSSYVTDGEIDLDRVVDDNFDPPVTLGVRLVSVISDDLQHAGQAAYVIGLWKESRG